jgi:hypothetical protein
VARTIRSGWALLIAITLGGCARLQAMHGSPDELQQRIARGGAFHVGDRMRITTAGGRVQELTVTAVRNDRLSGSGEC